MIRVNLLKNRREPIDGLESAIAATGPSAFINRREIVAGSLFLALGAAILYVDSSVADGSGENMPLAASVSKQAGPGGAERATYGTEPARFELSGLAPDKLEARARPEPAATPTPAEASRQIKAAVPATPTSPRASSVFPAPAKPAAPPAASLPQAWPSQPATVHGSGEFSALDVSRRGAVLQILATIGSQPPYQMFRLNSPNRVVVDLSRVTLTLPADQRQLTPSDPLVERIRIAQFQVSPPKVRMVFDVSEFPEIAIKPATEGLSFQVAAPAP